MLTIHFANTVIRNAQCQTASLLYNLHKVLYAVWNALAVNSRLPFFYAHNDTSLY